MGLVPPRWGWRGLFAMGVLMGAPVAADVAVDSSGFVVIAPRAADLVPSVVLPGAESADTIINERAGGVAQATPAVTEVRPARVLLGMNRCGSNLCTPPSHQHPDGLGRLSLHVVEASPRLLSTTCERHHGRRRRRLRGADSASCRRRRKPSAPNNSPSCWCSCAARPDGLRSNRACKTPNPSSTPSPWATWWRK